MSVFHGGASRVAMLGDIILMEEQSGLIKDHNWVAIAKIRLRVDFW